MHLTPASSRRRGLGVAAERAVGADEVCDGNGCRSPRSSTAVFSGQSTSRVKLPRSDDVAIEGAEVREYLLSPSHPVGRFKARLFAALGFDRDDPEPFLADLRRIAESEEVFSEQDTKHGRKYTVQGTLQGPSGSLEVITVWIRDPGREYVRW